MFWKSPIQKPRVVTNTLTSEQTHSIRCAKPWVRTKKSCSSQQEQQKRVQAERFQTFFFSSICRGDDDDERTNTKKNCVALEPKPRDFKCACSVRIRFSFSFFFSFGCRCTVRRLLATNCYRHEFLESAHRFDSTGDGRLRPHRQAQESEYTSLECGTKSNWNLLEHFFVARSIFMLTLLASELCDCAVHSPSIRKWKRRRHTKKPNAIEDKSIWSQFALSLLSGIIFYWNWLLNATESHLRPSFIAFSCAIFRLFFSGGCTFDSLAFRFTIPRFFGEPECASVCLKQTVCAILNCHFLGNAPMRCSCCPTDWYAATDNVSLFFVCTVGRFASRFFVSCALELKWNRNRLWCRCRPANAPCANLVSRRFELFLFFFIFRLLEQLPRILRSSWVHNEWRAARNPSVWVESRRGSWIIINVEVMKPLCSAIWLAVSLHALIASLALLCSCCGM